MVPDQRPDHPTTDSRTGLSGLEDADDDEVGEPSSGPPQVIFQPPEVLFQSSSPQPPSGEQPLENEGSLAMSRRTRRRRGPADIPISIYLSDEGVHEQVEEEVERWLATAGVSIDTRGEPVIGSWFRRLAASLKRIPDSPAAREAAYMALHVADGRLVASQDAYVTATLLQGVGPVLQALQPTKDAVVRAGALLILKVDWAVQVYQLTAAQQVILDHTPSLPTSPKDVLAALQLTETDYEEGSATA